MHLTETTYRHLLARSLPRPLARSLAPHLGRDCDQCEDLLLRRPEADGLDGRIDTALAALARGRGAAGDDLEFARIMRRVAEPVRPVARPASSPAPRRLPLRTLALAATVAIAGFAGLLLSRPASDRPAPAGAGWDGVKGPAEPVPLRLRFLVLTPAAGGPPAIERGVSGQEVSSDASLQFQVELGRPAEVVLARQGTGGAQEVFLRTRLPAGRSAVAVAGQPAAYPLSALAGPQRFVVLASETPIDPADVARAAALGAAARAGDGQAISLDLVEVQVRPAGR